MNFKVSDAGWLCVLRGSDWIPLFKLTPSQLAEWRIAKREGLVLI